MRESKIEQHLKDTAERLGLRTYKWVCPSVRGVPDQIVLAPILPEHQEIVAHYVRLVETKAPGKEARGQQVLRHKELRDLGFRVEIVDNMLDAELLIRGMLTPTSSHLRKE